MHLSYLRSFILPSFVDVDSSIGLIILMALLRLGITTFRRPFLRGQSGMAMTLTYSLMGQLLLRCLGLALLSSFIWGCLLGNKADFGIVSFLNGAADTMTVPSFKRLCFYVHKSCGILVTCFQESCSCRRQVESVLKLFLLNTSYIHVRPDFL